MRLDRGRGGRVDGLFESSERGASLGSTGHRFGLRSNWFWVPKQSSHVNRALHRRTAALQEIHMSSAQKNHQVDLEKRRILRVF